ncbi:MAG TPA: lipoprotein-releasing system ATP-binding protein LolD [candidate division Zixibacteria bacterium]|nr:lipoprotein-releasing system ATP-binding protein LolD [candidate division Zixibacteria bacterium]
MNKGDCLNDPKLLLEAENITKRFRSGDTYLDVLKGVNLELESSRLAILSGPSGSGKSTLLYILGGLEKPDSGRILFDSEPIDTFTNSRLDSYRNQKIGFVFQMHYLLPDFTALENVLMPAMISGQSDQAALERAKSLLAQLSLLERINHYPNQLSGGEQQRVAVARALMNSPRLIFADEPTGNLDRENAIILLKLFRKLVDDTGVCILIATHDPELAEMGDKTFRLHDGKIVGSKNLARG